MLGVCSIGAVSAVDTVASDDFVCPHLSWECEEISGFFTPSTAFVSVSVSDPVSDSVSDSLSALDTNSLLNISLVDNVTLLEDWHISGDVQLCLNGYMLDLNGHHVVVEDGGNLSLYDCGNRVWQFTDTAGIDGLWKVVSDIESDVATEDFTDDTEIAGEIDGEAAVKIAGEIDGEAAGEIADEIDGEVAGEIAGEIDGEAAGEIADEIDGEAAVDISIPSSITITGGIITNGSATNGGGVEVEANGNFTMFSGNIVGNNATENGGGVFVADGATFTNLGGNILGNAAKNVLGADIYNAAEDVASIATLSMGLMATSFDSNFSAVTHTGHSGEPWQEWNHTNTTGPTIAGYYVLTENIVLTNNWTVPVGTTYLCLNGSVMNQSGYQIVIPSGATLIIEDCHFEDPAHIHYFDHANETEAWVWNETNTSSPFQVRGGAITGGNFVGNGGAIDIEDGGNLTMLGGNIVGNAAIQRSDDDPEDGFGGAIFVVGTFIMHNGNIIGNEADAEGGGVMVGNGVHDDTYGTFIMYGGNITDNYSPKHGGGVALFHSESFTMHGGKVSNNTAYNDGGGVYVDCSTFTMRGGSIENNTARYGGGVVVFVDGLFDMIEGNITGNSATHFGSGVSLVDYENELSEDYGFMNISASGRVIIKDNYAASSGLPDNLYIPTTRTIKISNGVTLASGSEIHIRYKDSTLEKFFVANTTNEANTDFFYCDLIGNFHPFFENNAICFNLTDSPDPRFGIVEHHHPGKERITWYGWNNSAHITPNGASHYVLTEDVVLTEKSSNPTPGFIPKAWIIPEGETFLCLNGYKLDLNDAQIYVGKNSRLIICDCCHTTHNFEPRSDGLWQLTDHSTEYNITGGFITDSQPVVRSGSDLGGAIYINGGVVTMLNGNIVGNTGSSAGGVYVNDGGIFRMESGSIAGNVAYWGGGGVEVALSGLFEMNGGEIRNNVVTVTGGADSNHGKGGGICLGNIDVKKYTHVAQFTMAGGRIYGNKVINGRTNGNGNGIYVDLPGRINLTRDATIDRTDDVYFAKNHDNTPIFITGHNFTGSVLNLTLVEKQAFLHEDNVIIHIDSDSNLRAEEIYNQFALGIENVYALVIINSKNINLNWNGLGDTYKVSVSVVNESFGSVSPKGDVYFSTSSTSSCNVKITPNTGRYIASVKDEGVEKLPGYISGAWIYSATSITSNRNIVVTFDGNDDPDPPEILYHVTIPENIANGTVVANRSTDLNLGDVVQLTARPETGHLLGNLTVTQDDGPASGERVTTDVSSSPSETIYNFAMPEANVTVNAIFGLVGDANNDHEISIIDSACVGINIIRGDELPLIIDDVSLKCADVNGDGSVNVLDLYMINGYLVGLRDSFPAAAP